MKNALLLFSFLIFNGLSARAAKWYVATTGNDNNAGTLAAPFKTLPKAIEEASPGDVIELRGGTYTSQEIRVPKNNLTIRSYPGEWAIIKAVVNVEDISACIWYNEPETTGGTLERLEIIGGYYYGIKFETNWDWDNSVPFAQRRGASNITVRDCKIHDTGRDGIKLTPACANISILNCEIYNTGKGPGAVQDLNAEGIDNVNAPNLTVRGCYIHNTATTGIYVKGGGRNCVIEQNTVENCGEGGIYLGFYTDAEWFDTDFNPTYFENINGLIVNNLVRNTKHAGIGLWGAKDAQVYHNTVINGGQDEHAGLFFNTGDVWIDDNTTAHPASQNVRIQNNIFVQSAAQDLAIVRVRPDALAGNQNIIDNNFYFDPNGAVFIDDGLTWEELTLAQWKAQTFRDLHSFDTDPKLDASGHLQSSSPCISKATVISTVKFDIDGGLRDGSPDVGADEYGAASGIFSPSPAADFRLKIMGNPASSGRLVFEIFSEKTLETIAQITGPDGRVWQSQPLEITVGNTLYDLKINELPSGWFVLNVGGAGAIFVK